MRETIEGRYRRVRPETRDKTDLRELGGKDEVVYVEDF